MYSDGWKVPIDDIYAKALMTYIKEGGNAIFIHNGISLANNKLLQGMTGGAFREHPDMVDLVFSRTTDHPIMKDVHQFVINEEPYLYDISSDVDRDIFMTYDYNGSSYESGWTTSYGKGRCVILHPGHNKEVFMNEMYQKVIRNSIQWAITPD